MVKVVYYWSLGFVNIHSVFDALINVDFITIAKLT